MLTLQLLISGSWLELIFPSRGQTVADCLLLLRSRILNRNDLDPMPPSEAWRTLRNRALFVQCCVVLLGYIVDASKQRVASRSEWQTRMCLMRLMRTSTNVWRTRKTTYFIGKLRFLTEYNKFQWITLMECFLDYVLLHVTTVYYFFTTFYYFFTKQCTKIIQN